MAALTSGRGGSTVLSFVLRSRWLSPVVGAAVVAALAIRLGAAPFIAGARAVTGWSLAAAFSIALVTTICSAWRWTLVGRRLGVELELRRAVAMYYRAQFLNTTLPGGVLGDVHRGVQQGRDVGDVSRGVRSVVYERLAGQAVQLLITVIVLVVLPSPLPRAVTLGLAAGAWCLLVAAAVTLWLRRRGHQPGLVRTWSKVAASSAVAVAGYTAVFVLAARVAGVEISTARLLPLAMLVLAAMALPTNIGGWGPREGMAVWAFGLAGVGSSIGLTTATVYGVMTIVSCVPGGVVLVAGSMRKGRAARRRRLFDSVPQPGWAAVAEPKGGTGG